MNDEDLPALDKHRKPLKKVSTAEVRESLRAMLPKALWRLSEALDAEREVITMDANGNETIHMVPDMKMRKEALKIAFDRGLGGVMQSIDLTVEAVKQPLDLSKLTNEELSALRILERAQARFREEGVGKDLVEVQAVTPLASLPPLIKR